MPEQGLQNGAFLWVAPAGPAADRSTIEAVAGELGLTVQRCSYEDVFSAIRARVFDLVAFELPNPPGPTLNTLRRLREQMPSLPLLAVAADSGLPLMRAILEAGASDVLFLPLDRRELEKALIKLGRPVAAPAARRELGGRVITVHGVRGGLGATTLAVNLAVHIAALSKSGVALVDLDLQRGDVAAFLNLAPAHTLITLADAPGQADELFLHHTLIRHPSGIFVLAAPPQIEDSDLIGREHVQTVLHLLRARFPFTVIDTSRTLTDATLGAFEQTEKLLLLTDLSVPGVRAARRMLDLLARLDTPADRVELVLTEAERGSVPEADAVKVLGKEPAFVLPHDRAAAQRAMNAGTPLNGTRPATLTNAIAAIAAQIAGAPARAAGGRLRRLFGRRERHA
jgi:pilus assembly protein CpaE